ncbi:PcfJ domain-containing protein [Thermomonas sp.]|uniref:PcfJ domain-containing protein n=1 Tax=Thermomonas sp. TaxID=1971895 RepID=UPI001EBAA3AA|nr:PcfJ domain-containing protein [Thermomonas sp.]MBK6415362.1 PcfJ domain-containing protein [Thermomonas sp.]
MATPLALFEEGRALRHCVYAYAGKCRDDQVRLFSARMEHQGRVGTRHHRPDSGPHGWRIWDIRGSCNRRMGGHWIPLARQVAEAYTRNALSTQLPLPMEAFLRMPSDVG